MSGTALQILESVSLAPLTTIGLGGPARYFARCTTVDECRAALAFARTQGLPVFVLGGGSNTVFADETFPGLVLHVGISGLTVSDTPRGVEVNVGAGEDWDTVVSACVSKGLAGIECLAGIPGTAGATPIQNVGAYGQEVRDTLVSVRALDRTSGVEQEFTAADCRFGYRSSRFKGEDAGQYLITGVTFRLEPDGRPRVRYPELQRALDAGEPLATLPSGTPVLTRVRETVLRLRRAKGMVIDPSDPDTRSVGSFFMNPVLDAAAYAAFQEHVRETGVPAPIPSFPTETGVKIPAAWLVEHAGFPRGTLRGGVGISTKHALALVNRNGSSRELLDLAEEIRAGVYRLFHIRLSVEPVVVAPPYGNSV